MRLPSVLEKKKLTTGDKNLTTQRAAKTSGAYSKDYPQEEAE